MGMVRGSATPDPMPQGGSLMKVRTLLSFPIQ